MRKHMLVPLAVLLTRLAVAQEIPAPTEVDVSAAIAFPGFQAGGLVEFLTFPWGVDIGEGSFNYLGWGAGTGILLMVGDTATIGIPLYGIFAGRFGFIPAVPIDWLVRMGVSINAGFYGSSDFAVNIESGTYIIRPRVGFTFVANPDWTPGGYEPDLLYSALLSVGIVFPQDGFKGVKLF